MVPLATSPNPLKEVGVVGDSLTKNPPVLSSKK
jgi:hypothetical protein